MPDYQLFQNREQVNAVEFVPLGSADGVDLTVYKDGIFVQQITGPTVESEESQDAFVSAMDKLATVYKDAGYEVIPRYFVLNADGTKQYAEDSTITYMLVEDGEAGGNKGKLTPKEEFDAKYIAFDELTATTTSSSSSSSTSEAPATSSSSSSSSSSTSDLPLTSSSTSEEPVSSSSTSEEPLTSSSTSEAESTTSEPFSTTSEAESTTSFDSGIPPFLPLNS